MGTFFPTPKNKVNYAKLATPIPSAQLEKIFKEGLSLTGRMVKFWRCAHGWAPDEAAEIMSVSRLDWQLSLTHSLERWIKQENLSEDDLILAWANLGALTEGAMKLFFCVYLNDYTSSQHVKLKNGKALMPDVIDFEYLRQLIVVKEKIFPDWAEFLETVQYNRNAIHAFKDRKLADQKQFTLCAAAYFKFLQEIDYRLPYPY